MRAVLATLLVLLAALGLYFMLSKDKAGAGDGTAPLSGPSAVDPAEPAAPPAQANLEAAPSRPIERREGPAAAPETKPDAQLARLDSGRGTVTGEVVDEKGAPVAGAEVRVTRYGSNSFLFAEGPGERVKDITGKTGKDGRYALADVPVYDNYAIVVTHEKFSRYERSPVAVRENKETVEPRITLVPGVGLAGRITDTGGNAVPNALLKLSLTPLASLFGDDSGDMLEAKSDGEGRYSFMNLAPGNYSLSVVADGYGRQERPNINIDGKSGATQDVVLEIAHMIAGTVRSLDGTLLPGASVGAYSMDNRASQSFSQVATDQRGEFLITDVPQGRYLLQAKLAGYEMVERNLRVETGEMAVQIQMRALPRIRGQVVAAATGQPIPGYVVQLRQPIPNSTSTQALPDTRIQVSHPEGRFELGAPAPSPNAQNEFRVHVIAPGFADTLSAPFVVTQGSDVNNLVVRVIQGGTLRGRVIDSTGKPVSGVRVSSHHKEWSDDLFMQALGPMSPYLATEATAVTNDEGVYVLANLMPETYQVMAKHPEYAGASQTNLTVADGGELTVRDIVLPAGGTVTGFVYGPNGSPLAGALVRLNPEGQFAGSVAGGPYTARSDDTGRYSIQNVKQGTYGAYASRPSGPASNPFQESVDMKATKVSLSVRDGSETPHDFKLNQ